MAITLKVNGRDLGSAYLRAQQAEDGLVIDDQVIEPQFGGSSALREGQFWVSDSAGLKEWTLPLLIGPGTADANNLLIQQIKIDLFQGAQVEFNPGSATNSTFTVLERGVLDTTYTKALYDLGYVACTLRLWTKPFGNTGSTRWVASMVSGTGMLVFPVTGVLGDISAVGNLVVQAGSGANVNYQGADRVIWALTPFTGATPMRAASLLLSNFGAGNSATIIGASGRTASQYVGGVPVVGLTEQQLAVFYTLATSTETLQGRHRVFLTYMSSYTPTALAFYMDLYPGYSASGIRSPTKFGATYCQGNFGTIDLGEVTFPRIPSGQPGATGYLQVYLGLSSHAAINATPNFRIDSVVLLPVDYGVGIVSGLPTGVFASSARLFHHVNGYPTQQAWSGSTTYIRGQYSLVTQGDPYPRIPVTGSPVASTMNMIVWAPNTMNPIGVGGYLGNDLISASLSVNERFSFLR